MSNKLNTTQLKQYKILITVLGLVFFCFSIAAALLFQKLILPNMTSMLVPGTGLTTDSASYDLIAMNMAEQVRLYGWSSWALFPEGSTSGHTSILAALYVVFGHDPTLAIPMNALFHALGGILIFMIAVELSASYFVGICSGVVASFLFILFPSALNWYGQLLKDGYSIVAVLAILFAWIKGMKTPVNSVNTFYLVLVSTLGLGLLVVMRPYFFKLTLVLTIIVFFAMVLWRALGNRKAPWAFFMLIIFTFAPIQAFLNSVGGFSVERSGEGYASWQAHQSYADSIEKQRTFKMVGAWRWEASTLLPNILNQQLETVATTRVGLIESGLHKGAGSMIDINELPSNVVEIINYVPRAFQIALLAPFPTTWLDDISAIKILSAAEMTVIYLCLLGLIPLIMFSKNPQVILALCFSSFFLLVYGFITANIGALYRVRYAFELIMVMLGVIGWMSFLDKKNILKTCINKLKTKENIPTSVIDSPIKNNKSMTRKGIIGAGVLVSFLTLVGFTGFFLRDVLMAHHFGFGKNLDEFFLALLIPMFVVTVFCAPLGAASVPFLKRIIEKGSNVKLDEVVAQLVSIILITMIFVAIVLYFSTPAIFESFEMGMKGLVPSDSLSTLLILALVILVFSGVVIIGNAVLMAKESLVTPSAAQIVVPLVAVLALLVFGAFYGVVAAMAGMVVGQLINLIIVHFQLKKYKVSLVPRYKTAVNNDLLSLWGQYFPLLASAFFAGVMLPIDTMLASTLEGGDVSIFNLGMKIVLFISGLLAAVVSNVMLPYFSSIVEKNNQNLVKKELSFFMLVATFSSIPVSVMFYIWSENIVRLVFYSSTFSAEDLLAVQSVMEYSVVQIPFFICNILLLKYATATRHLTAITLSAFVGLLLNIGLSLILMPVMGVSGIALATSIAMIASSILILVMLSFYGHVSIVDMVLVLLNWMLFLTLIVAVHFASTPSIVMAVFSYCILLVTSAKLINQDGLIHSS